jgi:hypothetical protein
MNKVGTSVAIAITALVAGCTSISSTVLNRQDDDVFVGNSNGRPRGDGQPRPFKGVPMTIRVPTHLDIAIKENILLFRAPNGRMQRIKTAKRSLFVEPKCIETDKVFMVDVKRPLAGALNYKLVFGSNVSGGPDNSQYFNEVKTHLADTTIQDVNTALGSILPLVAKLAAGDTNPSAPPLDSTIATEVRTVAWKRFDLDAPDLHQQVAAFVEQHLNCCNDCHEYPDVADAPPASPTPITPWHAVPVAPPATPPAPAMPMPEGQTGS